MPPNSGSAAVPDVTVVVPAHNALPYVRRTLQSLVDQTIGHDRMEIVVVDDGSTDGTGAELDEWAKRHPGLFRVVHQAASGGPATPRNTGLDLARGRYVYFVDADDYLGVEALERLVATAEEHGSDIVLGKMVSDGVRGVPKSMYRRTDPDVDLFRSRLWWTLAVLKLYRRSLIEEHGLRFPTHFPNASDQPFAGLAYLRAKKISVNADYGYYYVVRRDDGGHVTSSGDPANRLDVAEWMCSMLEREVPDREQRERLLARHCQIELRRGLGYVARSDDPVYRRQVLARVGALVRTHLTPTLAARLNPRLRVALHLAGDERLDEALVAYREERQPTPFDVIEDDGRWFARLPYFRDPAVPVPDRLYDITRGQMLDTLAHRWSWRGGVLTLSGVGSAELVPPSPDEVVQVIVRRVLATDASTDRRVEARRTANGELDAQLDLARLDGGAPLPEGRWDLYLRIARPGSTRIVRIGAEPPPDDEPAVSIGADRTAWCTRGRRKGMTIAVRATDVGEGRWPGVLGRLRRRVRPVGG